MPLGEPNGGSSVGTEDAFDFEQWDLSKESLPAVHHPVYDRLYGHLTSQHSEELRQLQSELDVWKALGSGDEAANTQAKIDAIRSEYAAKTSDHAEQIKSWEQKLAEATAGRGDAEAIIERYLQDEAERFARTNADVLKDPEKKAVLMYCTEGNIDPYDALDLVNYPKEVAALAIWHVKNGVASSSAVRLAIADSTEQTATGANPADEIASGVDDTPSPGMAGKGQKPAIEKLPLADARHRAAIEALGG